LDIHGGGMSMSEFLERYLKKSNPEEITYADFQRFLSQKIPEHQNLEYKSAGSVVKPDGALNDPSKPSEIWGFAELAKDVAGFANAEGGLLVLGVKEKEEKDKNRRTMRILPGQITPIPSYITREIIENKLISRIQYPVDGLTIIPLRSSIRSKGFVYLIDVPQSTRPPHRVNELYYYQRYNFSVLEMKHFQIADIFGRRLAPDLEIEVKMEKHDEGWGHIAVFGSLVNRGRAIAKYVTVTCQIVEGSYRLQGAEYKWERNGNLYFWGGSDNIVYPDLPFDFPQIMLIAMNHMAKSSPFVLSFGVYAENMPAKQYTIHVPLNPFSLTTMEMLRNGG